MQTDVKNVWIENCDFRGGNEGVAIGGVGPETDGGNSQYVTGLKVFTDNVHVVNCRHSLLCVQTSKFVSANFQIGGSGFGGYAHIANCYGEYSGDVGVEVNAISALVENTTIKDAAQEAFYYTNYNTPQSANGQEIVFRNCVAKKIDLSSSLDARGWASSSHWSVGLGTLIIDHCAFYSSVSSFQTGEAVRMRSSFGMAGLTINNFRSVLEGISYSAANNNKINPVMIGVTGGTVHAALEKVELIVRAKKQPGAGILLVRGIDLRGKATIDLQDIRADLQVMNMPAYSMCGIYIGNDEPTTLHGTIQRLTVSRIADDSNAAGIILQGTATLTIDRELLIKDSDFSVLTKGNEVRFARVNENKERVYFFNNKWGTYSD
jgi:hypothetical protein